MNPKRHSYDLDSYIASVGKVGRLQTLQVMPVIAGDSMQIDFIGALRMSPLRRVVSMDAQLKLFAFYIPHRHIYTNWIDWLKAGYDGGVSLAQTANPEASGNGLGYLPASKRPIITNYLCNGYNQIWNEYFRIPAQTDNPGEVPSDLDGVLTGAEARQYGARIARLPNIFSTGATNIPTTQNIDTTGDVLSLMDLAEGKAKYTSSIDRDYFAERYRDLIDKVFSGGMVNTDADQRPTLLGTESKWVSGYDVDGTADQNLGEYTGKSQCMVQMNLPTRFFQEHGAVWIMAALRYPPILAQEAHMLTDPTHFSDYTLSSGDPATQDAKASIELKLGDVTDIGSVPGNTTIGYHPNYQYLRQQPNNIHPKFLDTDSQGDTLGYPFTDANNFTSGSELKECSYDAYHTPAMFSSQELADWNMVGKVNVHAKRIIKPSVPQVYAISKNS